MVSLWGGVFCYAERGTNRRFVNIEDKTVQKMSSFAIRHRGDDGALFVDKNGSVNTLHRLYSDGSQDNISIDFEHDSWRPIGASHNYVYGRNGASQLSIIHVGDNRLRPIYELSDLIYRIEPSYDNQTAMVMCGNVPESFIIDVQSGRKCCKVDYSDMRDAIPMSKDAWLISALNDYYVLDTRVESKIFLMAHNGELLVYTYYESLNALSIDRDDYSTVEPSHNYGLLDIRNLAEYALATYRGVPRMYMMF